MLSLMLVEMRVLYSLFNFHVPWRRFKEHVQSNHPKHFLSEEEFVKLRVELSKSSLAGMISEDDAAVAQEELPPGTEDLADPAKVKPNVRSCGGDTFFSTQYWLGLAGVACSLWKQKRWSGLKRCLYVSSRAHECRGGSSWHPVRDSTQI